MADADWQYKKKRRTAMQETWLEQFYNEMDAEKRLDILNTNADKTVNASEMANHSKHNSFCRSRRINSIKPLPLAGMAGTTVYRVSKN